LSLVEKWAFSQTGLIQIVIPASVEILDEEWFSACTSVSSIPFD
jgi:hypothetical protein